MINRKWNAWRQNVEKVEEKRTRIDSDWYGDEGTIRSQTID